MQECRKDQGGVVPVSIDVVEVHADHPDRVAGLVLLEIRDQILLVRSRRLRRPCHQREEPQHDGYWPASNFLRRPHGGAEETGLVLSRQADAQQHDPSLEMTC